MLVKANQRGFVSRLTRNLERAVSCLLAKLDECHGDSVVVFSSGMWSKSAAVLSVYSGGMYDDVCCLLLYVADG